MTRRFFQGVARARGRLRAIAQNAEGPPRRANHIGSIEVNVACQTKTVTRAQECRVAEHQTSWQQSLAQQPLRAVEIGQHHFKQARALGEPGRQLGKLASGEQRRNWVEVPRSLARLPVPGAL